MDHQFDHLARRFARAISRRAGLRAIAALPLVAAAATADAKPGDHRQPGPEGPCGDGSGTANRCRKHSQCCTGYCKKGKAGKGGRCRCVSRGQACTKTQTCCGGGVCKQGICSHTKPVGPSCTAATCPNGCCLNDVCQPGETLESCGTAGGACQTCSGGDICFSGVCGQWTYQSRFGSTFSMTGPEAIAISADGLTAAINDNGSSTVFVATRTSRTATTWTLQSQFSTLILTQTTTSMSFGIAMSPDLTTIWVGNNIAGRIAIFTRPTATDTTWTYQDSFGSSSDTPDVEGIVISSDTLTLWATDYTLENVSVWTRPTTGTWAFTKVATFGNNVDTSYPINSGVTADTLTTLAPSNNSFVTIYTRPMATSTNWTKTGSFGDSVTTKNAWIAMVNGAGTASLVFGSTGVDAWTNPGTWTHQGHIIDKGSAADELNNSIGAAMTPDGLVAVFTDRGPTPPDVSVWIFE